MKKCEKCGKYIEDSATYCSYCGSKYGEPVSKKKEEKVQKKFNYLSIVSMFIAILPTIFTSLLLNIVKMFPKANLGDLLNGSFGTVISVLFLITIIIGPLLSIIAFILSFKRGGFVLSILAFLISTVFMISTFINIPGGTNILDYLKAVAAAGFLG